MKRTVAGLWVIGSLVLGGGLGAIAVERMNRSEEGATPSEPAVDVSPVAGVLQIVGTAPLEGDLLGDHLTLYFNEPVAWPEDAAETWPFTVTPAVGGLVALGPTHLSFRPDSAPEDAVLQLTLHADLKSEAGNPLDPNKRTWNFASFELRPTRVWLLEEDGPRTVLGLAYPARVEATDVAEHLTVTTEDGTALPVSVDAGTAPSIVRVILTENESWPIRLSVTAGLPGAGGLLTQKEDVSLGYPEDAELRLESANWNQFDEYTQSIGLNFSSAVNSTALREAMTVTDEATGKAVEFSIGDEYVSTSQSVYLQGVDIGAPVRLTLRLPQGFAGAEKAKTLSEVARTLEHRPRPLTIENTWFEHDGRNGLALTVYLSIPVDGESLGEHVVLVPDVPNRRVVADSGTRFQVFGDWRSKQQYRLQLTPGVESPSGAALAADVSRVITTDDVPPYVGFDQDGKYYFPRQGQGGLNVETRNVKKTTVSMHRMFPANIAVALGDMGNGTGGRSFNYRWAEDLGKAELTPALNLDTIVTTPVPLATLLPGDSRGVFCVTAESDEGYFGTKLLLRTDIGILSHWTDDGLVLFAHNLYSLEPLEGATATVYSAKNQLLGTVTTNDQGLASLRGTDKSLGAPAVIVVEHGEDYTFLELERREDPIAGLPEGAPNYDREGYDAFLYADRNLYRPGETVRLRWLVRTNYGDALGAVPLVLKVVKPNGRSLLEKNAMLSELGSGALDLATQKAYPTGKYTAQIHVPGSMTLLGSYEFSLEDFVPNRIKTEVTAPNALWLAGSAQTVHVNAQHLFGAPAAGRKADAAVVMRRGGFAPAKWEGYRFDNDSNYVPERVDLGEAETDGEGGASFAVTYTAPQEVTFPMTGRVVGRVYELGGRAVENSTDVIVVPNTPLLGVALAAPESGSGLDVHAAAINADESPATLATVKVTLEKQVWNYYVRRYYGHHEPNWSESFDAVETRDVSMTDGRGTTHFDIPDYGYYRVRVHSDVTPMVSTASFYGYPGRFEAVSAPRPSLISLTMDRTEYTVGDTARVGIESPFDGRGIVVVQGDDIHQILSVEIAGGSGTVELPILADSFPNVWVEATVVHAIDGEHAKVYPFSSFAMTPLRVNEPVRRLDVTLSNVPEEIRPLTTLAIDIAVRNAAGAGIPAEITVAAVDEGIHGITNYANPDPYGWLARVRRPDYRRAHYYDKVAYDFDKASASGGAEVAKRAASLGDNWIKPVALWSGVVTTGEDGNASVSFDVPEFTGRLRLVAVANGKNALGAGSGGVYVRRPYMLRTSMPRFLLTSDRAGCRGAIFNHRDAAVTAKVRWTASGALNGATGEETLTVPPQGEMGFVASIAAGDATGQGELLWEATILDESGATLETLTETALIPVRPPAAYQTFHDTLVIDPKSSKRVELSRVLGNDQAELALTVGANPMLRLETALKHVVGYPYGCVEQTTSRLLPMYLLRKQQDLVELTLKDAVNIDNYLMTGIDRLVSMQTGDGGLSFWPGGETSYGYGSVYALHFLTLVKRGRELPVPEPAIEALQGYVRGLLDNVNSEGPSYTYLRAYALYTLALGGDLRAIEQIDRFDRVEVPLAGRYLLAAALAENTDDRDRVSMYLANTPSAPYTAREQGGTLNSGVRNASVELLARLRIGGQGQETAARASELIAFLEGNRYGTTHETAFACAALSSYLDTIRSSIDSAAATIAGPESNDTISGSEIRHLIHRGAGGVYTIENTGAAPLYVTVAESGVPTQPDLQPVSEGIAVTSAIYTSGGEPFEGDTFQQTGNYIVALTLECERDATNVVVADILPAGFEIVNPRLSVDAMPGGDFAEADTPAYLDVRDDRIIYAYDTLTAGKHYAYYIVSAVTPGAFQDPPALAECMYDLQVRGRSETRNITVASR